MTVTVAACSSEAELLLRDRVTQPLVAVGRVRRAAGRERGRGRQRLSPAVPSFLLIIDGHVTHTAHCSRLLSNHGTHWGGVV